MREQALSLWQRGFNVIPVPRPDDRHDGKVPVLKWKPWQTARQTEADVCDLFPADAIANIAILTGAISNLVVVDGDSPAACRWITKHLPYTPWQTKTPRGYHCFYRHAGVPVANAAKLATTDGRLAIDVRGDGGYVIAPGSIHQTGVEYLEAGDWTVPIDRVPRFWPGWLAKPRASLVNSTSEDSSRTYKTKHGTGDVIERARRYLAAIPRPEIGAGSDQAVLYAACRLVRGFGLSDADAEALLWDWAGGRPGWTRAWVAQKVRSAAKYGTEPIGALR